MERTGSDTSRVFSEPSSAPLLSNTGRVGPSAGGSPPPSVLTDTATSTIIPSRESVASSLQASKSPGTLKELGSWIKQNKVLFAGIALASVGAIIATACIASGIGAPGAIIGITLIGVGAILMVKSSEWDPGKQRPSLSPRPPEAGPAPPGGPTSTSSASSTTAQQRPQLGNPVREAPPPPPAGRSELLSSSSSRCDSREESSLHSTETSSSSRLTHRTHKSYSLKDDEFEEDSMRHVPAGGPAPPLPYRETSTDPWASAAHSREYSFSASSSSSSSIDALVSDRTGETRSDAIRDIEKSEKDTQERRGLGHAVGDMLQALQKRFGKRRQV